MFNIKLSNEEKYDVCMLKSFLEPNILPKICQYILHNLGDSNCGGIKNQFLSLAYYHSHFGIETGL